MFKQNAKLLKKYEDDEKGECCGNVQSLFFQQMLPRLCPQSQHCSGDIAVNDEENEDKHGDDDDDDDNDNDDEHKMMIIF